jgi:hypothetical protein
MSVPSCTHQTIINSATCTKCYKNAWAAKNKEAVRLSKRKYEKSERARIKRKANAKKNHKSLLVSKQKYRAKNRAKCNALSRAWKQKNPKLVNHYTNLRRNRIRHRTPTWADLKAIRAIYLNCPEGHEVDHIVPIGGKNVSGLHVAFNLQYLPTKENQRKSNKFNNFPSQ